MARKAPARDFHRLHHPLTAAFLEGRMDDYQRIATAWAERQAIAEAAPACCVVCRFPLLAAPGGFQFCAYERAGQHAKVMQAAFAPCATSAGTMLNVSSERAFKRQPLSSVMKRRSVPNRSGG